MRIKNFEKKEELFESALKEFTNKSYDQASLNSIIKNAGMSKGSFYYHFQNKMNLYKFVIDESEKLEESYNKKWIEENCIEFEKLGIFDMLEIHGKAGIRMVIDHPEYFELWKRALKEDNPQIKSIINDKTNEHLNKLIYPCIQNSIDKGEIRTDFSLPFIKSIISNNLLSFFYSFESTDIELGIEEISNFHYDYLDFIKNGLSKG